MKVLIVDDSLTELGKLKQIIERAGHQVVIAKDGVEALERARQDQPDLIFMDIVMPRMDGFRATRSLKADALTETIPVVLVSTKNQAVDVAWAQKQGAQALIGKPYSPSQILEQLSLHQK